MQVVWGRSAMLVALALVITAPSVSAQSKRPVKAPVVKRAQDPDVIEAAGGNLAIALNVKWDGGEQEVIALKGCTATVKTSRKALEVLTIDEQTFDAGDLVGGDVEPNDNGSWYEVRIYSVPKLRPFVTRKRTMYVDGAVRTPPTEKVVFLSIAVPSNPAANVGETMMRAIASYRDFCARR